MDCKKIISWLKRQPTKNLEKLLKKSKLPTQLEDVFVCRCIKQYSFNETNDKLHITNKQQELRIQRIIEKMKDLIIENMDKKGEEKEL